MKTNKFTNENLLFAAVFLLGLAYRLFELGRVPLSDYEAGLALPALSLARGAENSLLGQPGYINLTSLLFFLFGSSDFLARLIPVVSGSLLALAPLAFRRQLGSPAALLLAFFIVIDPGLTAFSRTAGGTVMALAFSLLAVGLVVNRRMTLAGVCAGMALLSGPQLWPGLISGGLAAWLSKDVFQSPPGQVENAEEEKTASFFQRFFGRNYAPFWVALALTALLTATGFFLHPQGLNAIANGLVEFLRSWSGAFPAPTTQSMLLFFLYEPFFLFLALFRGIKAWITSQPFDRFLFRWMLIAVLLTIANPGRTFSTAAWVIIPMLALAARQCADIFWRRIRLTPQTAAQAAVAFSLVVFAALTLASLTTGMGSAEDIRLKVIAVGGSIAILGLTTYLLGSGWGWDSSRDGLLAAAGALIVLSIGAASWHAAGLGRLPEREMWRQGRTVISADLLRGTLGDISEYNTGRRDTLDIKVAGVDDPALEWALRDFLKVELAREVSVNENASILLTLAEDIPPLGEMYRGQKIEWASRPAWDLMNPDEWPEWLFYRKAPVDTVSLIVWVRTDLFPGAETPPVQPE